MKKLLLILVSIISFEASAQNIVEKENCLIISDSIKLCKNSSVLINKPYQFEFISIETIEKKKFNLKKLVNVAEIAGMGGTALGGITKDANTILTSAKVLNTANQVQGVIWTADRIKELNASDKAKKIVGKEFIISKWENSDLEGNIFILYGKIDNKDYKINLNAGIGLNEIIFKK